MAAADLPAALSPELATLVDKPQPGDWLYEIKFDGYRMLVRIGGRTDVRFITRRGNDWTPRFPRLKKELVAARLPPGWYDGELVALDTAGIPNFNALQLAIEGPGRDALVLYLFDAPFLDGRDLRRVPVEERRALLQARLKESPLLRFSQELPASSVQALLSSACEMGLEGVIGKRRGSPYVQRRSDDWIKLKCTRRQEFVIGGYTWPDSGRIGVGALLVGTFDAEGVLHYAGKVGTGFTGEMLAQLRQLLDGLSTRNRPFAAKTGHDTHANWARPELVCEVAYGEWPENGSLRHASFKGLREDKAASEVRRERAGEPAQPAPRRAANRPRKEHHLARISHPDRVIDASTGFTKLDLARYYGEVAPWILPHLKGRHLFIRRAPEGIAGPALFQEHPEGLPGLRGTDPALWPGHAPAIAIDTIEDLVNAVQMGMVELHPWNSTAAAITLPDRMLLDLDPGEGVPWAQVQEGALLVRALLHELGLQAWLKTSGGKGLHLAVPLKPQHDHRQVKAFALALAEHLARTLPQRFVAKSGAANRPRKIFVDYLRNGPAQTAVAAFSARARPGMGVSMTIGWDELPAVARADQWTIGNAAAFLAGRKDPWAGYWRSHQRLAKAMALLPGGQAAAPPELARPPSRRPKTSP